MTSELLTIGLFAAPVVLVALTVAQYLALRVRDTRATPPDPHLGRKAACYFFFNLAVVLALVGLTLSALDWAEFVFDPAVKAREAAKAGPPDPNAPPSAPAPPRDCFNDQQRTAAGLVTSGALHGLLFWLVARLATNDREFPAVRRAFAGVRFALAGVVVMGTSTTALVVLFQKGETDLKTVQQLTGVAVVWGPAAILHLVLLLRSSGWRRTRPGGTTDG